MTPTIGFIHRRNAHATMDSICLTCFATVATVQLEKDLVEIEMLHACNVKDIRHPVMAADYSTLAETVLRFLDHQDS
jgi:hypothetical protein